jgi:hypothetical protein
VKVTSAFYSLKAWGSIAPEAASRVFGVEGSGILRRQGRMTLLEKYYVPTNPQTSAQQAHRADYGAAVGSWRAMSEAERESWRYYQERRRRRPVMSGYNLFVKMFLLSGGNPRISPEV